MSQRNRRYWAIRTDPSLPQPLWRELVDGRLRQGWGYDPTQDLRVVYEEIQKGGPWWERLSETQKEVLPQIRMFANGEDSILESDRILVPNLPERGQFVIADVTGCYYFDQLVGHNDYGHILPVRLITENGINKYADEIPSSIRSTLRTPMRMWNLDGYGKEIEELVRKYESGFDLSTATSGQARTETAWDKAREQAWSILREQLDGELGVRFQAAEWEEPIEIAFRALYPGAEVLRTGGPNEQGADLMIQIPNPFGDIPWLILVQVKNYTGVIDTQVLNQIRTAHDYYRKDGQLISLVVMTTAEEVSRDYYEASEALSKELGVPIEIVLKKKLIRILTDGFLKNFI